MSVLESMLVAGVAIPLLSFAVLCLFGARLGKPRAGWVAVGAIGSSCLLSLVVLIAWMAADAAERAAWQSAPFEWTRIGEMSVKVGVKLDSLTVIMYFMVAFVSTCIHVFSLGYMAGHSDEIDGESKYHRFFAYLNLFCFSMLGLVTSSSLVFLFVFWELVGICSYLLIGFYFHKRSASNAAIKAFVTNRVGDLGFILGLGMVLLYLGDMTLDGAAATFEAASLEAGQVSGEVSAATAEYIERESAADPAWRGAFDRRVSTATGLFEPGLLGISLATWMGILLFCGAIGKSAQFPLHVWLPDAMEGPTPVSALIHAATMVAAGVYLVARVFLLLTPAAQAVVAVVGCITLTLGALVAVVQTDIKRVLAYSTISQLGYMILGMGLGAWIGALFHLLTHAFFKALMFLGSGQVIEGCHHEQDIRRMGGLRHKMPVTCWTFFVGVLAIAGAGIPLAHVGIGGYFSKDEILAVAYERLHPSGHGGGEEAAAAEAGEGASSHAARDASTGEHAGPAVSCRPQGLGYWLFWVPLAIAYVTPFYMMRCWWLTFMGKPRDEHVYEHAHESRLMYVPLVVLAAGTVLAGYFVFRPMVAEAVPGGLLVRPVDGEALHDAHRALALPVGGAFVIGFAVAWLIYRRGLATAQKLVTVFRPIHAVLVRKFFFDELYGLIIVGGAHVLKGVCYLFDRVVVDGVVNVSARLTERLASFSGRVLDAKGVDGAVNGVAQSTWRLGGLARAAQVGRIRNYVLFAACGATVIVLLVVAPWRR